MATTEMGTQATGMQPVRCANCDIELRAEAVVRGARAYCCEGCALGGPCVC
jgi:hypothetical protein